MKELSIEEKAKAYDEAIEKIKYVMEHGVSPVLNKEDLQDIFPELQKSEDEKIRKALIDGFTVMKESKNCGKTFSNHNIPVTDILAWLEKQGKETSWKPSKEEMDVLYSLAYITNQYDERKEEVIIRLYQDLKREFFNGSSYENMFPTNTSIENDVRRRSTIQVLEYARSLDVYNQFGKADIDKNIAWLEKLSEKPQGKTALEAVKEISPVESLGISPEKYEEIVNECIYGEGKPIDKVEPKFHEGDWVVISTSDGEKVVQINSVEYFKNGEPQYITSEGRWFGNGTNAHLWTIQDAKPGDVLANDYNIFIFSHHSITRAMSYCHINLDDMRFYDDKGMNFGLIDVYVTPATREQCNILFTKMKEAGYEWNTEEKELRKIE